MFKYINIVILLCVLFYLIYLGLCCPSTENFNFENIEAISVKNKQNQQLLNDITFKDVVVYENEPNGRTGLDRCFDNKTGHCVEYGQTGIAYYYPELPTNKYFGRIIDDDPIQIKYDDNTDQHMVFPNLR